MVLRFVKNEKIFHTQTDIQSITQNPPRIHIQPPNQIQDFYRGIYVQGHNMTRIYFYCICNIW
ncbi:MAG: hypothetical protein RLZZ306_450 [Bacteroidota bacterium]